MDIKYTLTLVASLLAGVFAFLNYKRSRRLENENFLYKSKVEVYSKIQSELIKLIATLQDNYFEAEKYIEKPTKEKRDALNAQADEIDKACFSFVNFMIGNSLLIPEKIFKTLSAFCDEVLVTDAIYDEVQNDQILITKAKSVINNLVDEAEKISYLLRDDLHIEQLNTSLYKRLK